VKKKPNSKKSNITRLDPGSTIPKVVTAPKANEVQAFGHSRKVPLALDQDACNRGIDNLNQLLADTMTLRDLYKKHHWQVSRVHFYQLHLLFDKHYGEQNELVDVIAERIMTLGGISYAMGGDSAAATLIPPPPRGREDATTQLGRLLHAHEVILEECHAMAREADEAGDDGTNDLIVSQVIRTNELQSWFLYEHVAPQGIQK
jgi:starvation-inducible DNA-binding protein